MPCLVSRHRGMFNAMRIDESVPYHASRLILLLYICGKISPLSKQAHSVKGRTLLAKLDFFIRYPHYLHKASQVLQKSLPPKVAIHSEIQISTVESRMVRYRYGPWDHAYYTVLGYLISKDLIVLEQFKGVDVFRLTDAGIVQAKNLVASGSFDDTVAYSEATNLLFRTYTGSSLKNFIYEKFPEVINKPIGQRI
jgi:hypothetical protein